MRTLADLQTRTPATRRAGSLVTVGGGERSRRPEPAGAARGMPAGGERSSGPAQQRPLGPTSAPATYPPELRASGACRSIRAAPTTADDGRRRPRAAARLKEPQGTVAGGGGAVGSAVTLSPLLALSSHWLKMKQREEGHPIREGMFANLVAHW